MRWLSAFLLLAAACGGDDAITRVVVTIDADDEVRQFATQLQVSAYATAGSFAPGRTEAELTDERTWPIREDGWPVRILLSPQRFESGRYRLVATATLDADRTVETQLVSGYVAGQVRTIELRLTATCIGVECPEDARCVDQGRCVQADVPAAELVCAAGFECTPIDSGVRDGAQEAGADGEVESDAGVSSDTGATDTGVMDTGVMDTGVMDTGAADTGVTDARAMDTNACIGGPSTNCADPTCDGVSCGIGSGAACVNFTCAELVCDDDADNDGDELRDCADSDCRPLALCIESNCRDSADNDGDGSQDCADSDCDGQQCGLSGGQCIELECREVDCRDSLDGDGDGDIDCFDSDCNGRACPIGTCQGNICRPGCFFDCGSGGCEGAPCGTGGTCSADRCTNSSECRNGCTRPDCNGQPCGHLGGTCNNGDCRDGR